MRASADTWRADSGQRRADSGPTWEEKSAVAFFGALCSSQRQQTCSIYVSHPGQARAAARGYPGAEFACVASDAQGMRRTAIELVFAAAWCCIAVKSAELTCSRFAGEVLSSTDASGTLSVNGVASEPWVDCSFIISAPGLYLHSLSIDIDPGKKFPMLSKSESQFDAGLVHSTQARLWLAARLMRAAVIHAFALQSS